jgi:hypothetical protein
MLESLVVALSAVALPIPAPSSAEVVFALQAGGVQIYRCDAKGAAGPAWVFDHPEAALFRDDGSAFGRHGAGPSWTATDGSSITADGAAQLSRVARPGTVPWLLLKVTTHGGGGALDGITYVERFDTEGGAPPTAGCDSDHDGARQAVHYSAVYAFLK